MTFMQQTKHRQFYWLLLNCILYKYISRFHQQFTLPLISFDPDICYFIYLCQVKHVCCNTLFPDDNY